jgi:RNA polymerase-binding protein DksA
MKTEDHPDGTGTLIPRPVIPEQWMWHFRTLAELRSRLMKDRGVQMAEASEPIEVDTESADSATDEFDHDLALAMWESKDDLLQEIDDAIQRMRDGSYGLCEETGKVIPAARLMAMPWTRYTLEAEEHLEEAGREPGPHIKPLHPFAPPKERAGEVTDETETHQRTEMLAPDQIPAPSDDTTA